MTIDQRLDRAERILILMVKAGDRARREWRQKINILPAAQLRNEEEWRAESNATNEKLNILIRTQMETSEQVKALALSHEKIALAQSTLDMEMAELAKSQRLTNKALQAFLESRRKERNGRSSN